MVSAAGHTVDIVFWLLFLAALQMLFGSGCSEAPLEYTEIKRIDEKVSQREAESFLRVVGSLPEKHLTDFPALFAPPPDWSFERTLPVSELVDEELRLRAQRIDIEALAQSLQRNRRLQWALRREQITPQQFVGLALAIGAALSRSTLRADQDLEAILAEGEAAVARLKQDTQPFHLHTPEGQHRVLREAMWIARVDRARLLRQVPPENSMWLVQHYGAHLRGVFPESFLVNPLDAVADRLKEQGIPFEDLSAAADDSRIQWRAHTALLGSDEPDQEFTDPRRLHRPETTLRP